MKSLPITCITESGDGFLVSFPLHEQTRSPEDVGRLTNSLLATITEIVRDGGEVSDGDVLQALAMVMAIRAHMVDAPRETVKALIPYLLDGAHDALDRSVPVTAGHG